ncbi:MAG: hypothetical protein WB952_06360 [Terriglobales bacterium]
MKSLPINSHLMISLVLVLLVLGLAPQDSLAQGASISVSPASLSFGIPTGTSPALSAAQTVTVSINGSGSVTFTGVTAGSPFAVTGTSCQNTLTAPTTCQVFVTFASSSTTLQTGTLTISATGFDNFVVPLSGAFGAIGLFSETNVTLSPSTASFDNLYPIANAPLKLSCPATPTGTLSSSPDGLGYVLVDNYVTLAIGGIPVTSGNNPPGNVCAGGPFDTNPENGLNYNDCFSSNYQVPAATNFGLNGLDPDTLANPGNNVLAIQPGNPNNAGGLPPIDVSSFLSSGTVQASFIALDQGYVYTNSTLFLKTNCSLAGITPGGSSTGNAITPDNVSSQTQTITFDAGPGQNISYNTSVANAVQAGTVTIPSGTTPVITDIGVPQSLFSQLVAGTSAAPAVCLRLTGEVDDLGQAMCKGYLVQCQFTDPNTGVTTTTGDNCAPTPSTLRNLFDVVQFASPDAPVNGVNFLYNSSPNACSNVLPSGGSCASGTGPGLLMGSDNWLCTPGSPNSAPCTPLEPDTATPFSPPTYSPGNCSLTGNLTGDLCPLNTLTQFEGAADGLAGGATNGKNSLFIPVVNMPLPSTQTAIAGQNASGWINSATINATFVSNQASYPNSGNIPAANGILYAPPYSLTYGLSPVSAPLPDPTYPVATDLTNYNTGVNQNLVAPICPSSETPTSFTSYGSFSPAEGVYNLHYFTTDCAYTEELIFNPQGGALTNPTANWASFPVTSVGIDTVAPTLSCPAPPAPNGTNGWYTTANISMTCSEDDDFSGFAPGSPVAGTANPSVFPGLTTPVLQGSLSGSVGPIYPNVASGYASAAIPQQVVHDLAGNSSDPQGPYPTPIDMVPPTIAVSYPVGNTFNVGQSNASITYKCADTGSGVSACAGQAVVPACPMAPGLGSSNYSFASAVNTSASQIGPHVFNVTSTDCAGNVSSSAQVSYTVVAPSADVAIGAIPPAAGNVPGNIKRGTTGYDYPFALDLSASTAYNVVITSQFTVPANVLNGNLSATYWVGPCSLSGCGTNPSSPVACSVSGLTITCNVGQVASVLKLQGVVVKVSIPVSSTATVGTNFSAVSTVSSANDPKSSDNSVKQTFTVSK